MILEILFQNNFWRVGPSKILLMDGSVFYINVIVFLLGLAVGSFLNVVIYRLTLSSFSFRKNIGGFKNRSYCPHCKHKLIWQDLMPIFSFLFLRGECRYCHQKISIQYPLVEISTGLVFLLVLNYQFLNLNYSILNLLFLFYISSVLIIIFVYDLKHYIIPDKVLLPAIIIAFFYRLLSAVVGFSELGLAFNYIFNFLLAAIIASAFFSIIFLIWEIRSF